MTLPLAATTVDAAALATELARCRVVAPDRLTDLLADFPGGGPAALAEYLVARGALTPFQADRALAGEARALVLGPYRLTGLHHRGVLGPVFRADKAGRAFAVRPLPLRSLWQAKQAKQLARTLAALPAHPAVVPLVDADSANGFHYLVWPLAEGELLADLVPVAGPLLPAEAATLLAHLAAALAALHARQVAHGLLTPHAVLLGPGNAPRLLGLGAGALLARSLAADESLFDTLAAATAFAGVLPFAAPEWVADPTRPTPAADQYALGAVGYFALTGQPPDGPRRVEDANPDVPADLAAAIDRLLRPDPADRFSGMDEAREVFADLAGQPPPAEDEPAPAALSVSVSRSAADRSEAGRSAGGLAWAAPGSGVHRPPDRDDSAASIVFDLPDPVPDPDPAAATHSPSAADTPPRPAPRPAAPRPAEKPRRLAPLDGKRGDLARPPVLPAAPLLPVLPAEGQATGSRPGLAPPADPAPADAAGWKKVRKKFSLFWQTPTDRIQVSVFGPPVVAHSQSPRLTVFLYPASAAESVGTLARAFQHEAVLLGTGPLGVEVVRGTRLAAHLGVGHVSVANPLASFVWRGNPHRLTFDLVVPWEAPVGPAPGLVSVGKDDVRIGKVEFQLPVFDGTG